MSETANNGGRMAYEEARKLLQTQLKRQAVTGKGLDQAAVNMIERSMTINNGVMLRAAQGVGADQVKASEVTNLIILVDGSGSMNGQQKYVVDAYNKMIEDLASERNPERYKFYVTLWVFRGNDAQLIYANEPVISAPKWTEADYVPHGSTPLYKTMIAAMGGGSLRAEALRSVKGHKKMAKNILVTITDGGNTLTSEEENGVLVEYNQPGVRALVTNLLSTEKWLVALAYAGSLDGLNREADALGIQNRRLITKDAESWRRFFEIVSASAQVASATNNLSAMAGSNTFFKA